jgi:hypothetical protein
MTRASLHLEAVAFYCGMHIDRFNIQYLLSGCSAKVDAGQGQPDPA